MTTTPTGLAAAVAFTAADSVPRLVALHSALDGLHRELGGGASGALDTTRSAVSTVAELVLREQQLLAAARAELAGDAVAVALSDVTARTWDRHLASWVRTTTLEADGAIRPHEPHVCTLPGARSILAEVERIAVARLASAEALVAACRNPGAPASLAVLASVRLDETEAETEALARVRELVVAVLAEGRHPLAAPRTPTARADEPVVRQGRKRAR